MSSANFEHVTIDAKNFKVGSVKNGNEICYPNTTTIGRHFSLSLIGTIFGVSQTANSYALYAHPPGPRFRCGC